MGEHDFSPATDRVSIDHAVLEGLQEREQRLAEAQRVAHIGSWEWDVTLNRVTWSDELYRVFGLAVQELQPTYEGYLDRLHPDDRDAQAAVVDRALRTKEPFESLHRVVMSDGAVKWVRSLGEVAVDRDGHPVRLYGTAQEISRRIVTRDHDRIAAVESVAGRKPRAGMKVAMVEPLAGLANRSLFDDRTRRALARARRMDWSTAVFAVDIDDFAGVNERFGHAVGDEVLTEAGRRLEVALRPYDTVTSPRSIVARLGGDVFLVWCENVPDDQAARSISARMTAAFGRPFEVGPVSVGIGAALAAPGSDDADALVIDAEAALRRAKSQGAGTIVLFTDEMRTQRREQLEGEVALRAALDNGQFLLLYQPKVLLANDRAVGVEALVRWQHPKRGLVPPDEFIPLAEETGFIVELGAWVIEEACRQASEWQVRFPHRPQLVMAVNLSARQFGADLAAVVAAILDRTGLAASSLRLEVTESTVMADVDVAVAILDQLKSLGVSISIDDFGTGYSSLAYLRRFPLDELKIDRSFVDGLGSESEDTAIVAAIVAMAHALQLEVVAEGVETKEQLERLRMLGCEQVQGYFLARPLTASALEGFIVEEGTARHASSVSPGGGYSAGRIVVADDSPQVLQLAVVSLTTAGFDVHKADNGRTAVELARVLTPSCVILDVRMPDMDGFEVCRTLRADPTTANCTIIMLTSNADASDKIVGFSAGADDYIVKPFAPRDLVSRVRAALRRHDEADHSSERGTE